MYTRDARRPRSPHVVFHDCVTFSRDIAGISRIVLLRGVGRGEESFGEEKEEERIETPSVVCSREEEISREGFADLCLFIVAPLPRFSPNPPRWRLARNTCIFNTRTWRECPCGKLGATLAPENGHFVIVTTIYKSARRIFRLYRVYISVSDDNVAVPSSNRCSVARLDAFVRPLQRAR